MDRSWWDAYAHHVAKDGFAGARVTCCRVPGVQTIPSHFIRNSGAGAMMLAASWGAERIVLLGYDCMASGGRKHWHTDHPRGLGNAGSLPKWPGQFAEVNAELRRRGIAVVNASRRTALTCFERGSLEECLR